MNHATWRAFIGGGNWNNGVYCGARCLNSNANPWNANGNVGLRGVCDHLCERTAMASPSPSTPQGVSLPGLVPRKRAEDLNTGAPRE